MNKPNIRIKQDHDKATHFRKLSLKDNKIDLNDPPEKIYRKIRAFSTPYLGAYIDFDDKKIVIDKGRLCTKIRRF